MTERLLLILLLFTATGCATMGSPVIPSGSSGAAGATSAHAASGSPVAEKVSDLLDALANHPLLIAANKDADDTLAWVAVTPLSPLEKFRASSCPTAIKLATADLRAKIAVLKGLLADIDTRESGTGAQEPGVVFKLTKLRYGPPGASGSDPRALLATAKHDVAERVTAVVDSCRAIVPIRQINDVLRVAAKAGLVGATGGAAAPFLGILP